MIKIDSASTGALVQGSHFHPILLSRRNQVCRMLGSRRQVKKSALVVVLRCMYILGLAILAGCNALAADVNRGGWKLNVAAFEAELQDLQTSLKIPGLAYVIVAEDGVFASNAFGVTQEQDRRPFTTTTPLRIASVTKSITAIIALQLVEEKLLSLDVPARQYVPELPLPTEVLVRHLLTHTSEGIVGAGFVYSSTRYEMLGKIIETVTGKDFSTVVRERILDRSMMHSFPSPDLGAHAALVSTVDDIGMYMKALQREKLISAKQQTELVMPSRSSTGALLPVSLGWFAQTVQGQRVMWSFGQDDPEHSGALLVRLPDRGLSLFILANSNLLSDPFRLLMGDVTKSPFAMSFMRLFAFSPPGVPLNRPARMDAGIADVLSSLESRSAYRYRDELVAWALIDIWNDESEKAKQKIDIARVRYPNTDPDPVLHFATLRIQDASAREQAILEGETLLRKQPHNRWILLAQGYLLQQQGRFREASGVFHRILTLPNQQSDSIRRLFMAWSWLALAQMTEPDKVADVRSYLQSIVKSGVSGQVLKDAQTMLEQIDQKSTR